MTELVTAREIPSERHLAWRLAHDSRVQYVLLVGALAGAYYGAAQIGYAVKFSGAVAAIVWLPVGVGISFLYLRGLSLWPGVLGDRANDRQHAGMRRRGLFDPQARPERTPTRQRDRGLRPACRHLCRD